ncbi:MAG: hypothetical protein B6D37_10025 [Sphingobacteriales bacterium UTBCD1]|jgi:hypothetical protein|nr:MAG: hypothetical protein B6D37_10025 [Sphingobacteriales bacterium UTBCD1]
MDTTIKSKKKPTFLVKLIIFIFLLIVLDFGIGNLLKYLYFKQDSGSLYRTTYALDSTRADILIFGSSTANHHYIPDLFEKAFHLPCYNTGRDGNTLLYSYAILKGVFKRYSPKIIILDINEQEFITNQDSYDRVTSLLPYYENHPEVRDIVKLKSPFENIKLLSKIYPYNSLIFTICVGNADFNKERITIKDQNGYVPLQNTWKGPVTTDTVFKKYPLDSTKINIFESFVKECIQRNIYLYICLSPKFKVEKYVDSSIEIVKHISKEFNVPFFNYSTDTFFLHHGDLFHDVNHLNGNGANIYSELVIRKILQKQ